MLLADYLFERRTVVSWEGTRSRPRPALGGSGPGTLLSVVLFTMTVDCLIKELNNEIRTQEPNETLKTKVFMYVDDIALVVHHGDEDFDWTPEGRFLDDGNRVNSYLKIIADFSSRYGMHLNTSKTCTLNFNHTKSKIIMDSVRFPDGSGINTLNQARLLGLVIDDRLRLNELVNTKYTSSMGAAWFLRRLTHAGVPQEHVVAMYNSTVRLILEFAIVGIWSMLNKTQRLKLESVQRKITKSIIGWKSEISYEQRLEKLGLSRLDKRWDELTRRFARHLPTNPRMQEFFQQRIVSHRMEKRTWKKWQEPQYKTEHFRQSPMNYFIRLLNDKPLP